MKPSVTLLTAMADDALVQGHRNSEWTGLGPIMEEDIAFSSMAQDKIGHAWALYRILHENLGARSRTASRFSQGESIQMLPPRGNAQRRIRFQPRAAFLFDHAEAIR